MKISKQVASLIYSSSLYVGRCYQRYAAAVIGIHQVRDIFCSKYRLQPLIVIIVIAWVAVAEILEIGAITEITAYG
jgi:hypothetical protein